MRCTTGLPVTLALGPLVAPLATGARPPTHVFRIGLLYASSPSPGTAEAFRQGLRDLGYVEGQNLNLKTAQALGLTRPPLPGDRGDPLSPL